MSVIARVVLEVDEQGVDDLTRNRKIGEVIGRTADSVARAVYADTPRRRRKTITASAPQIGPNGWTATVSTADPFWHIVEYGSRNNVGVRAFARAVTSHGLEFVEGR